MNFPLYIAKRYLFSKSSNNAINIITIIATAGVIVGAIALFLVLSVFSGLKNFSLDFIRVSDPDLKITSSKGKSFFFTDSIAAVLKDNNIVSYTKVVEEKTFFNYKDKQKIAYIKGVDANYLTVNNMDTAVYYGDWLDPEMINAAVVGNKISSTLSLGTYDITTPLKAYVLKPGKGYLNNPKQALNNINLQATGVFKLTEEIDGKYVFANLPYVQSLLSYKPNQISAVELKLQPNTTASKVIELLKSKLGNNFKIQTRAQLNAVFYKMINAENLVSYLVFTLILIIALFNVVGAIVMMILDKRENIKTLFNLGASIKEIRKVFVLQGFLLSVFGLLIGLSIAIAVVLLQKQFHLLMITPDLAYPVEFKFINVLVVILTITLLGFLAAKIASTRISKKIL